MQDLPVQIPKESTQSLANELLITLGTSSTKNDVNGDGSGLLPLRLNTPVKPKNRLDQAEKLGQTTSYESSSTSKSGEARSEGNGDGSILLIGD